MYWKFKPTDINCPVCGAEKGVPCDLWARLLPSYCYKRISKASKESRKRAKKFRASKKLISSDEKASCKSRPEISHQ